MNFKTVVFVTLIPALFTWSVAGKGWAILTAVIFFCLCLKTIWNDRHSNTEKAVEKTVEKSKQLEAHKHNLTPAEQPDIVDQIRFEYRANGNKGKPTIHTVNSYPVKLNGPITGWCIEKNAERTYLTNGIQNRSVTRTETGEVMPLKEWRKFVTAKQ
jgi:hypothetical protein